MIESQVQPRGTHIFTYNAEHSGDLGKATKEPWKGRPAATGRVLLRLVKLRIPTQHEIGARWDYSFTAFAKTRYRLCKERRDVAVHSP